MMHQRLEKRAAYQKCIEDASKEASTETEIMHSDVFQVDTRIRTNEYETFCSFCLLCPWMMDTFSVTVSVSFYKAFIYFHMHFLQNVTKSQSSQFYAIF